MEAYTNCKRSCGRKIAPISQKRDELPTKSCICERSIIVCKLCNKSYQICAVHSQMEFLIDARHCAYCEVQIRKLQEMGQKENDA